MNRRDFLKNTVRTGAVFAGIPYLVPGSALGKDGTTPASERIVMGCIGVGGQGTYNLKAFLGAAEDVWYAANKPQLAASAVQVVAVSDVDAKHAQDAVRLVNQQYNNHDCAAYNDFRDLLARDDIDAVTVCTPDHWHALITIAAARARKDIYCEKPLANTVAEGRAVCQAVERYGCVLQTGSHERSNHSVRFACELVRNGRIGKVHTVRVNLPVEHSVIPPQPTMPVPKGFDYDMWLGSTQQVPYTQKRCHGTFRYIMDYSGGEMTDRGAHILDLAQLGLGTDATGPVEIYAQGEQPRNSLFDTFVKFRFECLYPGPVRLIGESKPPRGIRFEGTDGWIFIYIHGGRLEANPESLLKDPIRPDEIHLERTPGHHQNFLECVRTRRQPFAPAETGHRTASICHLVNIALLTGQKLAWNPLIERFTNSDLANRLLSRPMRSPWRL